MYIHTDLTINEKKENKEEETIIITNDLVAKGIYAVPTCVKIGTNL